MVSKMNIIDFLNKHNIAYFPINVVVKVDNATGKKKKSLLPINGKMPKMTDFNTLSLEELQARQESAHEYDTIAIDTRSVQQVDIDDPAAMELDMFKELKDSTPYYSSITKGLPHAFVFKDEQKDRRELKAKLGDLLCGQWAWCSTDAVVHNADAPIMEISDAYLHEVKKMKKQSKNQVMSLKDAVQSGANETEINNATLSTIVGGLKKRRSDSRNDWMCVLWAIYNISKGSKKGYELAKTFSKRSSKYDDIGFDSAWQGAAQGYHARTEEQRVGLGTLLMMLKDDNREIMEEIMKELSGNARVEDIAVPHEALNMDSTKAIMFDFGVKQHYKIATVIKTLLGDTVVCVVDGKFTEWFVFKGHRWHCDPQGMTILTYISTELITIVGSVKSLLQEMADAPGQCPTKSILLTHRTKVLNALMVEFSNEDFKSKLLKSCVQTFHTGIKFVESLDSTNLHLMAFDNGVYDFHKMEFRDGRPSDMCSKTTGYDYSEDFDEKKAEELGNAFMDIFPEDEMRAYALKKFSYCLIGGNKLEEFYFLTGSGANGKGLETDFLFATFGQYAYMASPGILTLKTFENSSSAATPDLAKAHGVRILMVSETKERDVFNCGTLKGWAGGDLIQARALYKAPIEFTPHFKAFVQTNDLPKLSDTDDGVERRVKVIEHKTKFVENPRAANERKRSNKIKMLAKQGHYRLEMFHILKSMIGVEVETPKSVELASAMYVSDNDVVLDFINEHCDVSDPTARTLRRELYSEFVRKMGRDAIKKQAFFKKVVEKGHSTQRSNGQDYFVGIAIASDVIAGAVVTNKKCMFGYYPHTP